MIRESTLWSSIYFQNPVRLTSLVFYLLSVRGQKLEIIKAPFFPTAFSRLSHKTCLQVHGPMCVNVYRALHTKLASILCNSKWCDFALCLLGQMSLV
jgi:hypothetical protein